jgi:hypothetical protein
VISTQITRSGEGRLRLLGFFWKKIKIMKRIILVNGLIAGTIVSSIMLISVPLHNQGILNNANGMLIGYASMVIALSTIFFGIKTYRDQQEHGSISFWQACKVGVLIAIIGSLMYASTWEVYYGVAGNEFMDHYATSYIADLKASGATAAELETAKTEMQKWSELYKNPIIRFPMTLMEILPVGFVITLICAALLRRQKFLPA